MSDETTPLILGDAVAAELESPARPRWWRRKEKRAPPLTHCENCGTALTGPYCAQCGQPAIDYRRSFGSLLADAADAFFNFDARFFQSFGLLLVKPWRLTNEFVEGKRARHVHPLRVYLIASVTLFPRDQFPLARTAICKRRRDKTHRTRESSQLACATAAADRPECRTCPSTRRLAVAPGSALGRGRLRRRPDAAPVDAAGKIFSHELDSRKTCRDLRRLGRAQAKEKIGPTGDRGDLFLKALIQNLAPMVLCCIPLFALVLKILYVFKRRYYIDHLIFALHTHAFVFLSTVVIIGLGFLCAWKARPR